MYKNRKLIILILLCLTNWLVAQNKNSNEVFDQLFEKILKNYTVVDSLNLKKEFDITGKLVTEYRIDTNKKYEARIDYFGYEENKVNREIEITNYKGQKLYVYLLISREPLSSSIEFDKKGAFNIIDNKDTLSNNMGFYTKYVYQNYQLIDSVQRPIVFDKTRNIKIDDIYGQWWNDSDNNAAFSFYRDSLFYTDNKEYYKYQLKNDSLIIHYQDYTDKWQIIRVTNDSLIFKNRFHVIKELYRKDN